MGTRRNRSEGRVAGGPFKKVQHGGDQGWCRGRERRSEFKQQDSVRVWAGPAGLRVSGHLGVWGVRPLVSG